MLRLTSQQIGVAAPMRLKSTNNQIAFAGGLASRLDVEFAGMAFRTLKRESNEDLAGLFWVGKKPLPKRARRCKLWTFRSINPCNYEFMHHPLPQKCKMSEP